LLIVLEKSRAAAGDFHSVDERISARRDALKSIAPLARNDFSTGKMKVAK